MSNDFVIATGPSARAVARRLQVIDHRMAISADNKRVLAISKLPLPPRCSLKGTIVPSDRILEITAKSHLLNFLYSAVDKCRIWHSFARFRNPCTTSLFNVESAPSWSNRDMFRRHRFAPHDKTANRMMIERRPIPISIRTVLVTSSSMNGSLAT